MIAAFSGMSRLPGFRCLLLLLGAVGGSTVVNAGHQDGESDLKGSSSDLSNNALASPDGPNVYSFHTGGWPFSVDFPEPSFLPGYDGLEIILLFIFNNHFLQGNF